MATYLGYPFDPELFSYNWRNEKDTTLTAMFESGAVVRNGEIQNLISMGSDFYTLPIYQTIGGDPENYDGATDITISEPGGKAQNGIVYGRAHGWKDRDFINDYNSGADPMRQITSQVAKYWQKQRQTTMLGEINAVFGISDDSTANWDEWNKHNVDISASSGTPSADNKFGATTAGDVAQAACGDNAGIFSMAWMHSKVASNLAGLQLLNFRKYTDPMGIERQLAIADLNGLLVVVDDGVPVTSSVTTGGVYTLTISTAAVATDKINLFGTEYEFVANDASDTGDKIKIGAAGTAAQQAANIATKLGALTSGDATNYTYSATNAVVTITGKTGVASYPAPTYSKKSGTVVAALATTSAPVAPYKYTSYLMGAGAIHYATAPVKVPVEIKRDALDDGGYDALITRIRETIHPNGFSFTKPVGYAGSPAYSALANSANWSLVGNAKNIAMAKVISNG